MSKTKVILFKIIPIIIILMIVISNNVFAFENFDTNVLQNLQTGSDNIESANTAVGKVWNTIVLILQVLAVAAIIMAGVRYMFASADGKADIKKQSVGLVVGAILVFGASIVIDFVVNVTREITDANVSTSGTNGSTSNNTSSNTSDNLSSSTPSVSYKITPSILDVTLKIGESKKVTPIIEPVVNEKTMVKYISENTKVATVDSEGNVTAVGKGIAKIYIKVGELDNVLISTITVTQKEIYVEEIILPESKIEIKMGDSYKITPVIKPSNAEDKNLVYLTSDNSIATVDTDGKITPISAGEVTITIKNNKSNKYTQMVVKVIESHKIHFIKPSRHSDCILLESNGHYALIDTGIPTNFDIIKKYFEKLNIDKLDFLILTHNHWDHIGAAAKVIEKYKPDKLYLKKYYGNDNSDLAEIKRSHERYKSYLEAANKAKTEIIFLDDFDEGYTINLNKMVINNYNLKNHLINSATDTQKLNENGNCITSLVVVNGLKTYLASDLTYDRYADPISKQIGKVDVLKLAHHGMSDGTSQVEADYLKPDYAIVTVSSEVIKDYPGNAVSRVEGYTKDKKVYYTCDNTVIVDYTSGEVKVTEIK